MTNKQLIATRNKGSLPDVYPLVYQARKFSTEMLCCLALFLMMALYSATTLALAPTSNSQFTVFTSNQGIAVGPVRAVLQDREGFVWFGGPDGLMRYDGYEFEKFSHDAANPTSISHNSVWTVVEDQQGRLWVSTELGLNRFDPGLNQFTRYFMKGAIYNSVRAMDVDDKGVLWLGTTGGLANFNPETEQFSYFDLKSRVVEGTSTSLVLSLTFDRHGMLWAGTDGGGLVHFDPVKGEPIRLFNHDADNKNTIANDVVWVIREFKDGTIWLGSDAGISVYDPVADTFKHYQYEQGNFQGLAGKTVTDIREDDEGNVWVGTNAGLNIFDRSTEKFVQIKNNPKEPRSLGSDVIRTIYQDKNRDVWIGTFPQGVSFFNRSDMAFETVRFDPNNPNGLNAGSLLSMLEDSKGRLLMGTDGGGLNIFDPTQPTPKYIIPHKDTPSHPNHISGNAVLDILEDYDGSIWVGMWGAGLNRIDLEAGTVKHYFSDFENDSALKSNNVWVIYRDNKNQLWVGTIGGSLYRFDREKESFIPYFHSKEDSNSLSSNIVWSIHQDRNGKYWFGTDDGLDRYDADTGIYEHFKSSTEDLETLGGNIILTIHEDPRGILWIGTRGGGLNRLDPATGKVKRFGKEQGLRNESVVSILEDEQGILWLGTHGGISRFDPKTEEFRNYDSTNGLQGNQFNINTAVKLKSGDFIFGGTNGYTRFNARNITSNTYVPPVVFRDFRLLNERVPVGTEDSPLQKVINHTEHLTLDYKQQVLTFSFAGLSFRNPEKNEYAYMLEGFDARWNFVGSQRMATYTNLDAGNYVFMVKASNNEGLWTETPKTIKIKVLPPPWLTWWAYTIYTIIIVGLIGWAIQYQRAKRQFVEKQNKILEEKVAERTAELRAKNNDIQAMLSNMRQGLFTVQNGGEIHSEYSKYLESIFETSKIAGRNFIELLFGRALLGSDEVNQMKEVANSVIGEDEMNFGFNSHLLCSEYDIDIDGQTKNLSLDWNPITEDDIITKLMVSVRDVTLLKQMERESQAQKRELDMISQLIKVPSKKYFAFEKSARKFIAENRAEIQAHPALNQDVVALLFRNMHTIKGNCRTYGLSFLSDTVHNVETVYSQMKTPDSGVEWDQAKLLDDLVLVERGLDEYAHVYREVLGREEQGGSGEKVGHSLPFILHDIIESLSSIAEQLGKANPIVKIDSAKVKIKDEAGELLNNVFAHILRNSVDHGIEAPDERMRVGKNASGKIHIQARVVEGRLQITVGDDGRGLNMDRLFAIGAGQGKWAADSQPDPLKIAELIFASGVSTKDQVSEISGRGVGMDAARQFLIDKGGDIAIKLLAERKADSPFVPFEIVVSLPADLFVGG